MQFIGIDGLCKCWLVIKLLNTISIWSCSPCLGFWFWFLCTIRTYTHMHIYESIYIYGRALFKQPLSGTGRKHKATSILKNNKNQSQKKGKERKGTNGQWHKRAVVEREKRRQGVFHCNRWIPDNVQSEMRGKCAVQANATPTLKHWWHHGNTIETRNCQPSLSFTMTPFSLCVCVCV